MVSISALVIGEGVVRGPPPCRLADFLACFVGSRGSVCPWLGSIALPLTTSSRKVVDLADPQISL